MVPLPGANSGSEPDLYAGGLVEPDARGMGRFRDGAGRHAQEGLHDPGAHAVCPSNRHGSFGLRNLSCRFPPKVGTHSGAARIARISCCCRFVSETIRIENQGKRDGGNRAQPDPGGACNRRVRHPGVEMGRHAAERPAEPLPQCRALGKASRRAQVGRAERGRGRQRRPLALGGRPLRRESRRAAGASPFQYDSCAGSSWAPVHKIDPEGNIVKSFGAGLFVFPHRIYQDREGNIWVVDMRSLTTGGAEEISRARNRRATRSSSSTRTGRSS